ncbi:MAG: carboxypeptidase regulatory-like domain-containing protein [Prolixibacteraceae bacterium]
MKQFVLITLLSFLFSMVFAQNNSLKKLTDTLGVASTDFPKSKVFLKTDKDIYAPGEKIWFKAEILNCLTERPSKEVDLIVMIKAESGEVIIDQKYIIINGLVVNQLTIPAWAPEGNAYLIAYTPTAIQVNEASLSAIQPITINQLRSNDYIINLQTNKSVYKPGDEIKLAIQLNAITPSGKKEKLMLSVFDYQKELLTEKLTIGVNETNEYKYKLPTQVEDGLYFEIQTTGKNKVSQRLPIFTIEDRVKVEFYPEGGHLLSNNVQRIVYRAIDPFGNPADVSGKVYDQLGNQAGIGKILKPGLGLINLMPMPGQTYVFKIDSKYDQGHEYEMPETLFNGCAFILVKTEKETIKATIYNTGQIIGQELSLAAISNGEVKLAFQLEAKAKNSMQIATRDLPLGIINFVVMDQNGSILSERMIFNTPNEDIDINIETKVKPSATNGEVDIHIDATNFIQTFGNCVADVKVVDAQNLYQTTNNSAYDFLKYPLLTAIPKTVLDIYITNIELVANTYRYFQLQELLDGKNYLQKKDVTKKFSGFVTDKNGNRIPNARVMAVLAGNPTLTSTSTDENGRFIFHDLNKTRDMVIKAISDSGKKTYFVHLDHSFDETLEELLLLESFKTKSIYAVDETPSYYEKNTNLLKLAGSETKTKKPRESSNSEKLLQSGASVLDVIRMIKPFSIKNNQIVFYGTTNSILNQQGALIVIDGQKMGTSIDALNMVNSFEVASINVSTNPVDIQQYTALNSIGIIEIRTRGDAQSLRNREEMKKPEEYISKFVPESIPENVWKYQTTLYWEPEVKMDQNGQINLHLKLSELRTNFIVQVDLTSTNGITHRQRSSFSTLKKALD